jgi:hypothetical protein
LSRNWDFGYIILMNRRFILILAYAGFTLASILAVTPADYAGSWSFNREQSKDLPAQLAGIKTFELTVAAENGLKVDVDIETGQAQVPKVHHSFLYPLDGSERATTSEIMTPAGPKQIPTRLSGKVEADGKLELSLTRELKMKDQVRSLRSVEKWELSADARTLTVHVDEERPDGPATYAMVFEKKK